MGNIAVDVFKNINFNKVVDKEIIKNVNVTVDIENPLAEAEADAEAFGPNPLAQTDTFAYVNQEGGDIICTPTPTPGLVDADGNTPVFVVGDDINLSDGPDTVDINLTGPPVPVDPTDPTSPLVPSINSIIGTAYLNFLTRTDGLPQAPLPQPFFEFGSDLNLTETSEAPEIIGGVDLEKTYDQLGDIVIDFGEWELDCNGDCEDTLGPLTLTIQDGAGWLVTYENVTDPDDIDPDNPPPMEIEYLSGNAFFSHPDCDDIIPADLVFTLDSLNDVEIGNIGQWQFEADGIFSPGVETSTGGQGEAFAYSESTAALDLDPFIIEPEPVV